MNIKRLIIIFFAALIVVFTIVIYILFSGDSKVFYEKSFSTEVKEIFPVRGRPNQLTAKLSNDSSISVPTEFVKIIEVGDSLFKKSNSYEVTLKSKKRNEIFKSIK